MFEFVFTASDEEATDRFGMVVADALSPGTVIGLSGPLGAGKTRLVQAIAAALGVPRQAVTSPTFVLVNEYYQGRLPTYHFDAYRIKDLDEFAELGAEEYFEGDGVCLIEWADRVEQLLPNARLEILIDVEGVTTRTFQWRASDQLEPLARRIADRLTPIGGARSTREPRRPASKSRSNPGEPSCQ